MRVAAGIVPGAVPAILGEDREGGCFAMAWLPPESHPVWKTLLRDGEIDDRVCRGRSATRWGASTRPPPTAPTSPRAFAPTTSSTPFGSSRTSSPPHARIPTSRRASPHWSRPRARTRRVLVHGDFSPKNILRGPDGPGDPRRRVRVVRRPGVRSRVRPQPPAARRACGGRPGAAATSTRSTRWSTPTLAHVAWEPRAAIDGAHRGAAAGVDARSRRRQVAGRVPDRRRRSRRSARLCPRAAAAAGRRSRPRSRAAGSEGAHALNTTHRPRPRSPRLGFARPADRRGRGHARQRRLRPRHRASRRVARLARGDRPARRRHDAGRHGRAARRRQRQRSDRRGAAPDATRSTRRPSTRG